MTRIIALTALAALAAAPAAASCPQSSATYAARPAHPDGLARTLTIADIDRSEGRSGMATRWTFTTGRPDGRLVSRIRMEHDCPNGRGACTVSVPGLPPEDGGPSSEAVRLARDFSPAMGDEAAYAIILPGFATSNWLFTRERMEAAGIDLGAGVDDGPDLSAQTSWTLVRCGDPAKPRKNLR